MTRLIPLIPFAALTALAGGCAEARADRFDGDDPVACLVIFGLAVNGARTAGDPRLEEAMRARAVRLVSRQGGEPWLKSVGPEALRRAAAMEAVKDERIVLTLLDDCIAREDGRDG